MSNTFSLDVSQIPRELKVILEILKANDEKKMDEVERFLFENIDWENFINLAIHHRVYPLLYVKLKHSKLVPQDVIQSLSQKYKRNALNMLKLSAEMAQVSKILTEHNIRSLFLKGPILASELYDDLSHRTSTDLDVLVPLEKLDAVNDILEKSGYIKEDSHIDVLGSWKWRSHHWTYFNMNNRIKLEVHWRLNPGPGKDPSFNELWERKSKNTFMNIPVNQLGKEDLFLFLVTHGARHGWFRIRWLVDINKLLKMELEWGKLLILLRRFNYLHIAGQSLLLAGNLLDSKIIETMNNLKLDKNSQKLAQEAIFFIERTENLHTPTITQEVDEFYKKHLLSLMTIRKKLIYFLSFLYPFPIDADTLPLPKYLHFLYFPLRPILWVWRKSVNRPTHN